MHDCTGRKNIELYGCASRSEAERLKARYSHASLSLGDEKCGYEKPRIKVYVMMKTGTCFWMERRGSHVRFVDRPSNMFGVAIGQDS